MPYTPMADFNYEKYKAAPKYNQYGDELFCVCRQPDRGALMVCCDGCEGWFHFRCLKIKKEWSPLVSRFFCPFCESQGIGTTMWKRKCRLSWCNQPVTESKYCSREHGLAYMKEALDMLGDTKRIVDSVTLQEHLMRLGQNLPQPPEVVAFHNGDPLKLPTVLAEELAKLNQELAAVAAQSGEIDEQIALYGRVKDAIKRYNEAHRVKNKKTDICGYHRDIKEVIGEDGELNIEHVCDHDRRRCLHNGWLSLLNDEALRSLGQLDANKLELEDKITQKLQNYTVQVYEDGSPAPEIKPEPVSEDVKMEETVA